MKKIKNIIKNFISEIANKKIIVLLVTLIFFYLSLTMLYRFVNITKTDKALSEVYLNGEKCTTGETKLKNSDIISINIPCTGFDNIYSVSFPIDFKTNKEVSSSFKVNVYNTLDLNNPINTFIVNCEDHENLNIDFPDVLKDSGNKSYRVDVECIEIPNKTSISLENDAIVIDYKNSGYSNYTKILKLFIIVFVFLLLFDFAVIFYNKLKMHWIYLVNVCIVGCIIGLIIPVTFVPDEVLHAYTAYHYSNVVLGIEDDVNNVMVRQCDNFYETVDTAQDGSLYFKSLTSNVSSLIHNVRITSEDSKLVQSGCNALSVSNFQFTYWLAALGMSLARLLGLKTILVAYFGRFFNFLFFVCITTLAIYKTPKYKSAIMFTCMLPIVLQQAFSLSYDSFIIAIAMLIFSLTVKMKDSGLSKKEGILLTVICLLLAMCKNHAYIFVALLPLTILLVDKFNTLNSKNKKIVIAVGIALVAIIYSYLFLKRNTFQKTSILYFATHVKDVIYIMSTTLHYNGWFVLSSALSNWFGQCNIAIDNVVISMFVVVLFLYFFNVTGNKNDFKFIHKIVIALFVFGTIAGISYGLYGWTSGVSQEAYNNFQIAGLQGRYFSLLIPFLILALSKNDLTADTNRNKSILYFSYILPIFSIIEILMIYSQLLN